MTTSRITRRSFIQKSMTGAMSMGLLSDMSFIGCTPKKDRGPNNNIHLGFIGLGQQAMNLLSEFIKIPGVRIVAGADVYDIKRVRFYKYIKETYGAKEETCHIDMYDDYQDLLNNDNVDAVVIATPDHWHALIAIDACNAGKDVYLEKPLTFTVYEGQQLIKAVRQNKRILQVGSQQRSDAYFQHAVKMVQEGYLGELEKIQVHVGAPPKAYDLPEETIPRGLNWDKWIGPLPITVPYNKVLNPPISLEPIQDEQYWGAWRWYKETGGGFTTDWGAHMFDIVQWALNKDGSGPVKVIPPGINGASCLTYIYENGLPVYEEKFAEEWDKGVVFHGKNGSWLRVQRGLLLASDEKLLPIKEISAENNTDANPPHLTAFINAIRNRKDPNCPVEIGHSTCSMCIIGNIAYDLNKSLEWDPIQQTFLNDDNANSSLHYKYRTGYKL